MSFKESIRRFWFGATEGKCQYEYYDEKRGWVECHRPAKHIHHIRGEAETILEGGNPDNNVGMPLCEQHHVRNTGSEPHDRYFSFHPDMGRAYKSYREWKRQQQHLNEIHGRKAIDYSSSPFAENAREHVEKAKRGERYMAGTPEIDRYYEDKMRNKGTRHATLTGEKRKPQPNTREKKWYDSFFEDE